MFDILVKKMKIPLLDAVIFTPRDEHLTYSEPELRALLRTKLYKKGTQTLYIIYDHAERKFASAVIVWGCIANNPPEPVELEFTRGKKIVSAAASSVVSLFLTGYLLEMFCLLIQ
jgi:hypothetical protein